MPIFEYICDSCGHRTESMTRGDIHHCAQCGLTAKRRFSFRTASTFQGHFNQAVGSFVSNETEFKDKLKAAGDAESARTGVFVDYQPVDMQDREACGVSAEGAAEAIEARAKAGAT
jgi:putative FmdB family regulatory protein